MLFTARQPALITAPDFFSSFLLCLFLLSFFALVTKQNLYRSSFVCLSSLLRLFIPFVDIWHLLLLDAYIYIYTSMCIFLLSNTKRGSLYNWRTVTQCIIFYFLFFSTSSFSDRTSNELKTTSENFFRLKYVILFCLY